MLHMLQYRQILKMKSSSTKKTYLLLPDIIKQAKQKEERQNKENLGVYSQCINSKIPVSKYLESTLKPKQIKQILDNQTPEESHISLKTNCLFDEDQFIKQELEALKLKEEIKKCDTQLSLGRNRAVTTTNSKQKLPQGSCLYSRKSSGELKNNRSSEKKSRSKGCRNLLKEIKANKKNKPTTVSNSTIHRDILKDFDSSSRQEIEPVLNFLEQLKNTDKLIFDPEKFQRFLDGIKSNKQFHKALRTFVYSYFIQNELND